MKKSSLLWKISHPSFASPAYLFGTMHVQDRRVFGFNKLVMERLNRCTAFATEFNLSEAREGVSQHSMQLPNGGTYHDYLTPRQLEKIRKVVHRQTGIAIAPFLALRPLVLIQLLTTQLLHQEEQYSLDEYLFREAETAGKTLVGLESFATQIQLLEHLPIAPQFKSLVDISRNFRRFRQQVYRTTAAYEQADIRRIFQSAKRSASGMRHALLYRRNQNMCQTFCDHAAQHALLAAVGAAHLGGKKGMLRLLKQQGCKIMAV